MRILQCDSTREKKYRSVFSTRCTFKIIGKLIIIDDRIWEIWQREIPCCLYGRSNCRRNISTSSATRCIRKMRRHIRNYDTHFSRPICDDGERRMESCTVYPTINETLFLHSVSYNFVLLFNESQILHTCYANYVTATSFINATSSSGCRSMEGRESAFRSSL